MSASARPKISKRERKLQRQVRRRALSIKYRENCRDEIKRMRQLKESAESFRSVLKDLRHAYARAIAGRTST